MSSLNVCFVCHFAEFYHNKRNEVNQYNIYLENFKPSKLFFRGDNGLSIDVNGDRGITLYKEGQHESSRINLIHSSKIKLLQACDCQDKLYHPDCLIQNCLLTVNYHCKDCSSPYSLSFKESSSQLCLSYFLSLLVLILIFFGILAVAILLFTSTISVAQMSQLQHLNLLLGLLLLLVDVFVLFEIVDRIRNKDKLTLTSTFILKDKSDDRAFRSNIFSKKQKSGENYKKKKGSSFTIENISSSERDNQAFSNKDYIRACILFEKARLSMSLEEVAEIKHVNSEMINFALKSENKMIAQISEANLELKAEMKHNVEEKLEVVLKNNEKPKEKVFSSLVPSKPRSKLNKLDDVKKSTNQMLVILDNVEANKESAQTLKRENSFQKTEIKEDVYNQLCVKKEHKKRTEKKNNLPGIFNFSLKYMKKKGGDSSKEEPKVSLLGGVIKKKREKENQEKELKEKEQKDKELRAKKDNVSEKSNIKPKTTKERAPKFNLLGNYLKKKRGQTGKVTNTNELSNLPQLSNNDSQYPNKSDNINKADTMMNFKKKVDFQGTDKVNTSNLSTAKLNDK